MAYVYTVCTVHVTIFSADGKFRPVSDFTELHGLTLAACSCVLLPTYNHFTVEKVLVGNVILVAGVQPGPGGGLPSLAMV